MPDIKKRQKQQTSSLGSGNNPRAGIIVCRALCVLIFIATALFALLKQLLLCFFEGFVSGELFELRFLVIFLFGDVSEQQYAPANVHMGFSDLPFIFSYLAPLHFERAPGLQSS
jgi:hypothetical protein